MTKQEFDALLDTKQQTASKALEKAERGLDLVTRLHDTMTGFSHDERVLFKRMVIHSHRMRALKAGQQARFWEDATAVAAWLRSRGTSVEGVELPTLEDERAERCRGAAQS